MQGRSKVRDEGKRRESETKLTDVKESEEENKRERGKRGGDRGPEYTGTAKLASVGVCLLPNLGHLY